MLCHHKLTPSPPRTICQVTLRIRNLKCRIFTISGLEIRVASWAERGLRMATTSYQASPEMRQKGFVERWFFTGIAIAMLATSTAGFMPSLVHTAGRRAPLSPLAAAHGIAFFAWLLIFLVQSSLV